ncbi:PAS domain-containing protein [Agrilutibacter solisilvae]|uniref:histidine kinase n=1 Tax=Agrilutibacter solisilvae TaxID=2763317 RepID=A0A975AT36_9GAMM|nr:PAS domain-containing protein [Lysobacter solisilvae]QSX78714.1 PAS domain-containing protein [Lysobacter solisilvae]
MKTHAQQHVLAGGGEMGERLRGLDWGDTALGPVDAWPEALRTLVGLMLASNQPMYIVWGPSRAFLYNDHYAPFLGGKHPWALGRDILDEVWPEIRGELEPLIASAVAGDPVHVPSMRLMLNRNGHPEETYFSFFFAPVRDASGVVAGMFGACTDITGQMQLQSDLSARDARLGKVLANMDEAFVLFDRDFHVVEVNPVTERMTELGRDQLLGRLHWDLFPGTLESPLGEMYLRARATGRPEKIEYHYTFESGRQCWFEVRAFPVEEGLAVFFHDITRRREEAQAAELAAERVQLALDAGAILGTWVWLIPEDRISGDGRFAHLFGLDEHACREGIPLAWAFDAIHPDDRERVGTAIDDAVQRGGPYRCEYRVLTRDGIWAWVEANGRVEKDQDGRPVRFPGVLLGHDERHRVEAERDRALELLRTFTEAVPGVVYAKDREGRLVVGNRGVAELLGVPPSEFLGRTDRELLADTSQAEAVMGNDRRIMESGVAEKIEEEVQLADGAPATWLSTKAPWFDEEGNVVGLVGASIDITERRRLIEKLEQSDRRKDEFLAMLAHELRNPLAPIRTAAELLRLAPGDEARVSMAAQIIARQVAHMTELVDDLLDVSRVTRGLVEFEREPVDMRAVIAAAAEQTEPAMQARRHTLAVETNGGPAFVLGDRHRLVQVISNLLNNAAKYTPQGGSIRVGLTVTQGDVAVEVVDNGVGIEPSLLPHVFELFTQAERTPDRAQGGLGIGLALARSIVRAHGGSITASSEGPARGATFRLTLPRTVVDSEPVAAAVTPPAPMAARTILLVDDNRDAADMLARVLRLLGHDVTIAAGGREALDCMALRAKWDVFILDIGMPDMTGHELAARLRDRLGDHPARFIALTGYGREHDEAASLAAGFHHHVVKPVDVDRILALFAD